MKSLQEGVIRFRPESVDVVVKVVRGLPVVGPGCGSCLVASK